MIGDIIYIRNKMHTVVNDGGTLEMLPYVGFWNQLYIEIRHKFRRWEVAELRKFCFDHHKRSRH
jgi:hypothetical protein